MTKFTQVIFNQRLISLWLTIFLLLISHVFAHGVFAGFEKLLNTPSNDFQPSLLTGIQVTTNYPPITIIKPSVSFGDLLRRENPIPTSSVDPTILDKTAQLKKLLADLEKSNKQTLQEFEAKRPYPTPTLTDTLLLATLPKIVFPTKSPQSRSSGIHDAVNAHSSQTASGPTTTNYSLPTNILGAITQNTTKSAYTIALLGDSMTDTLGRDLPHLKNLLKQSYPNYTFSLLNYGYGSTDMESGLFRLTNTSNYLGVEYPALLSLKPDILVVESFAYNHWSGEKYDLDRQWVTIANIIDTVKAKSQDTKIILAASIAPNKNIFGDGVLNWGNALKENSTLIIKAYLQNMVNFATSEHYPLADAYHPTLDSVGNGLERYINSTDHLHPSNEGALLYSEKIMEAIKSNNFIQ